MHLWELRALPLLPEVLAAFRHPLIAITTGSILVIDSTAMVTYVELLFLNLTDTPSYAFVLQSISLSRALASMYIIALLLYM